jgi:hypothetical protein
MPRQSRLAWLGVIGRYVVLLAVLGVVASSVYVAVEIDNRPMVLRLAVAAFVGVVLIHIHRHMRRQLDEERPSAFDQARFQPPADPKIARALLRLRESIQNSVASQRYFKETLWPKLVRLSEERGMRVRLREPRGHPWFRRGPSLAAIAELVRRIGDGR